MKFVSPFIEGLQKLISSEGYPSLTALYDAEKEIIFRDLCNAKEDSELRIIQGRAKMIKKLRTLPEETIDRYTSESKNEQN